MSARVRLTPGIIPEIVVSRFAASETVTTVPPTQALLVVMSVTMFESAP